jgi:hypothetical protein
MIEERFVAGLHVIANHIARLVVTDAIPRHRAVALKVVDAVSIGLGFDQPVRHFASAVAVAISDREEV